MVTGSVVVRRCARCARSSLLALEFMPNSRYTTHMLRRLFLGLSAIPAVITARPPASMKQLFDEFSAAVEAWVPIENEFLANHGESPVQSQRQWEKVRQAFHELDVAVRNQ